MVRVLLPACLCLGVLGHGAGVAAPGDATVPVYVTVLGPRATSAPIDADGFALRDRNRVVQPLTVGRADGAVALSVVFDLSGGMFLEGPRLLTATERLLRAVRVDGRPAMTLTRRSWRASEEWRAAGFAIIPAFERLGMRCVYGRPLWSEAEWAMTAVALRRSRRVLVVVTDGPGRGDRRMTLEEPSDLPLGLTTKETSKTGIRDYVDRHDVLVYAIGFQNGVFDETVRELAIRSGGRAIVVERNADLADVFQEIGDELRSQYVLRFTPAVFDGEWHPLDVRLSEVEGSVRARQGYAAFVRPALY